MDPTDNASATETGQPAVTAPLLCAATDTTRLRQAFGCFPSGVIAVCASTDAGPVGMLVSSFTSVSLSPPLVSICIMETSRTWAQLRTAPRLGLSVLGDGHRDLCQRFGTAADRFAGLTITTTADGAVLLPDASALLDCAIQQEFSAGDHTIVLMRIHALEPRPATAPLVFHQSRYHQISA